MKKLILASILSFIVIMSSAVLLYAANPVSTVKWYGEPDKAVAAVIEAVQNNTRTNASGVKITSNAHSADFPGLYFIWDSKQKDNGYLKVDASVLYKYEYFVLTSKESNTYWDFKIEPQAGQMLSPDGCFVYYIPKVFNNKNINMVFLSEWKELPDLDIAVEGRFKVNRKITTYGTTETGIDLYERTKLHGIAEISITPLDDGVPASVVVIDPATEIPDFKELIIKQAGMYEFKLKFERLGIVTNYTKIIAVEEDLPPVANFDFEDPFYRGPDGKAVIQIADKSYSPDGDELIPRQWKIVHDVNNDGSFSGAVITLESDGDIEFIVNEVGKYQISLIVKEIYYDTIPWLLSDADYLSAECVKVFEVDNLAPAITGNMGKEMRVEIVAAFGDVSDARAAEFRNALQEVRNVLEERGVKTILGGVETRIFSVNDEFSWQIYEHKDYSSRYTQLRPHSIEISNNGKDVKMMGYNEYGYKDFVYLPNDELGEKIFTFDLQSFNNNWHSIQGGGFLFNTYIGNGVIDGYCILVTGSGLQLTRIVNADLERFRAGSLGIGQYVNRWQIANPNGAHSFKFVVSPTHISVWDNGILVINEFTLPTRSDYYGFGPITSHNSHSCSQMSYFTFNNLTMASNQNYRLADVLNAYDWNAGYPPALIHMSDAAVTEFDEEGAMGEAIAAILSKEIYYVGAGDDGSTGQFKKMADNTEGDLIGSGDISAYILELADLLYKYAEIEAAANPGVYTVDDGLTYSWEDSDPENDPRTNVTFGYFHDPNYFPINNGLISDDGVFGSSKSELRKVGKYSVHFKISDIPSQIQALATAYSKSSEDIIQILVTKRPIANLKTLDFSNGDWIYAAEAYSPNREGDLLNNDAEWKWKNINDASWQYGLPGSGVFDDGGEYLVSLRVQDEDGVWSKPAVVNILAFYNISYHTVRFVDWDGAILKTQLVPHGSNATPPVDPSREGHAFLGWDRIFSKVTSDMIVTALYNTDSYEIKFVDWDGSVLEEQYIAHGLGASAPADPKRTGYTFIGWDNDFSSITSSLTITALFEINKYIVKFVDWDGSVLKEQPVDYLKEATAPDDPERDGCTFIGWDKGFSGITDNLTVTALYEINFYKVIFMDWDGSVLREQSVSYLKGAEAPDDPERDGYTFIGWDKDFSGITDNLTVTALYEINFYMVIFMDWDGSVLSEQSVSYLKGAEAPDDPERDGYTFIGWDVAFDEITDDLTVNAQYIINE